MDGNEKRHERSASCCYHLDHVLVRQKAFNRDMPPPGDSDFDHCRILGDDPHREEESHH